MDVTDLARRLVATPSHEDETAAGDLIAAWLEDHTDATVDVDERQRRPGPGVPAGDDVTGAVDVDGGVGVVLEPRRCQVAGGGFVLVARQGDQTAGEVGDVHRTAPRRPGI